MAHDICLILFGHLKTHRIFFVGIGLPTGINETKLAAFCRNSRLKTSCTPSSVNFTFEVILMRRIQDYFITIVLFSANLY